MLSNYTNKVAAAFGVGSVVSPLQPIARGEMGRVWRLDTEAGSFAIKEPFEPQSETQAVRDVGFQEAVSTGSNVPMPRPIRTSTGSVLAEVGGQQLRAYEWVDLSSPSLDLDPVTVGTTVALIHRVDFDRSPPLHPWYTDPVGAQRWNEIHRDMPGSGAPFADAFASVIPRLIELEAVIEAPCLLQCCHRDLWADNILPTPSGGICVIDWENCGLEDPSHELAVVLYEFGYGNPSRLAALYSAYRECGGPARLDSRGGFTMVIAQFGHFFEKVARAWLDPGVSDERRTRSVTQFSELMTRPLTVERIDEILDSISQ